VRSILSKKLFLLGLPIGNMGDVSQRLKDSLEQNKVFYVEDTRNFFKLLNLLQISSDGILVQAFHEHNQERVVKIVDKHINTDNICIVSDAGSPVLSDPGFPLVREWLSRGGLVESISGPSAALVALEVSGLPPLPFKFHGFLPKKKEAINGIVDTCESGVTHIFFESPHRIKSTVDQICKSEEELNICVVRELTKKFEEHYRFSSRDWPREDLVIKEKGEFVLLFHKSGDGGSAQSSRAHAKLVDEYLKKPTKKSLARLLAEIKGGKVSDFYDQL
jgi:16S rRNA (cytidine1402-2'-O)-methyltransferase